MEEVKRLKLQRELLLFKKYLSIIKDNPHDSNISDKKFKDFTTLLLKNLVFFNNISIKQYSRFGFTITYIILYKNKKMFEIEEKILPDDYNRYIMNDLILSDINKKRYYKYWKEELRTLSEIEY